MSTLEEFKNIKSYLCYTTDKNIVQSSSGGVAMLLYKYIISVGGIAFGVKYSQDYKSAVWDYACNEEDLWKFAGSKYIETQKLINLSSHKKYIWETVADNLEKGIPVLFVGLGCDVGVLKAYLRKNKVDDENLYAIDLICHGPTKTIVQEKYIENLEKRYKSTVAFFSVKYKLKGWTPSYIYAEMKNGKKHKEKFDRSDYRYAFDHLYKSGCLNCHYKGKNHISDLTIGDFWGMSKKMGNYNPDGCSVIFVNNNKGKELIAKLEVMNNVFIDEADTIFAIKNNPMYYRLRNGDSKFDAQSFEENIKKYGLHKAVVLSVGKKYWISRLKRYILDIVPISLRKQIYSLIKRKRMISK